MKHLYYILVSLALFFGCTGENRDVVGKGGQVEDGGLIEKEMLPSCQWCGAMDAPEELDWQTRIAEEGEPGEKMILC